MLRKAQHNKGVIVATLEIAAQDAAGVRIAKEHGAKRVELCVALGSTGGLTPSVGLIREAVKQQIERGVHVLIRTRPGNFCYTSDETRVHCLDIDAAIEAGASGVVLGALDNQGHIDIEALDAMLQAVHDAEKKYNTTVEVTFHKAFDIVEDWQSAMNLLIERGVTRILTSGGAPNVGQGIDVLREMVQYAQGRIQIQAGGGLKIPDIAALMEMGIDGIHLSAKTSVPSPSGPAGSGADMVEVTNPTTVDEAYQAMLV